MPRFQTLGLESINFSGFSAHTRLSYVSRRQWRDIATETALLPGFMVFSGCLAAMHAGSPCIQPPANFCSQNQSKLPALCSVPPNSLAGVLPAYQSQLEIHAHQDQPVNCGAALSQANPVTMSAMKPGVATSSSMTSKSHLQSVDLAS